MDKKNTRLLLPCLVRLQHSNKGSERETKERRSSGLFQKQLLRSLGESLLIFFFVCVRERIFSN